MWIRLSSKCVAMFACSAALICGGCSSPVPPSDTRGDQQPPPTEILPTFATLIVDFSASFAPLTQTDRLALKETARALGDLAVQEWHPPTTIVWRKIGTASATPAPLCDVLEYKRSIIGAVTSADRLHVQLDACAERVVRASRAQGTLEPYTDISGGIMMAAQNWAAVPGRKVIIILSDFIEDLPKGAANVDLRLHNESILVLHRPGTTEGDNPSSYLNRVNSWRDRLLASGAKAISVVPTFRATRYTVDRALTGQSNSGTSIAIVRDLGPISADQQSTINSAITLLSMALSKQAAGWPAPVIAGWFSISRPAWRTVAVPPVVYTPRLARRSNELNTTEAFQRALEETGLALQSRGGIGNGDIDGSLRLITNGETAMTRALVLLSDVAAAAPSGVPAPFLKGEHVLMIYRASTAADSGQFFDRLHSWHEYFKKTGAAKVCALDITTLTESAIGHCLQP
jgi:hypothetical protein